MNLEPRAVSRIELAKEIYNVSYLRGKFLLRSGSYSDEYFDKYRFESRPHLLREIAKLMAPLVPKGTQYLAGLEMGGIPIATALSLETEIPVIFVRKRAKEYGTTQFAEGGDILGKRLCIIEDVITTGGQVVLSTKDLRTSGAIVQDVLCVIYRGAGEEPRLKEIGLSHHSLFTMNELKDSVSK